MNCEKCHRPETEAGIIGAAAIDGTVKNVCEKCFTENHIAEKKHKAEEKELYRDLEKGHTITLRNKKFIFMKLLNGKYQHVFSASGEQLFDVMGKAFMEQQRKKGYYITECQVCLKNTNEVGELIPACINKETKIVCEPCFDIHHKV